MVHTRLVLMETMCGPQADEELLLLEGLEMYGLGNWAAVGEHVNRSPAECAAYYEVRQWLFLVVGEPFSVAPSCMASFSRANCIYTL